MVNWKKWFLEEDEDEVYEQENQRKNKRAERKKQVVEDEDFDIEFSSEQDNREINLEDYDYDETNIDPEFFEELDEEVEEDEKKVKERSAGFMSKVRGLFSSNDHSENHEKLSEDENEDFEEAEDYKTYLERQKREESSSSLRREKNSEQKEGFFARMKDRLFSVEEEDEDLDSLFDDMYEEEPLEEVQQNAKKEERVERVAKVEKKQPKVEENIIEQRDEKEDEIDFVELRRKNREKLKEKAVEEYEELDHDFEGFEDYDNLRDEEVAQLDEIDLEKYEEKEEPVEELEKTTNLNETLKKLGVENAEIRDVDLFGDKSERRTHPTLAAVRTKRLKQDHKIEKLGNDVVLGRDNKDLKEEVAKNYKKVEEPKQQIEEVKTSKEREQLAEDFNKRTRREDKIVKDNPLFAKKDEKFEAALDEIKEKGTKYEKEVPELEVKELEAEGERRDKLKYTSVDDVLRGADDLFEDDIDRVSKKLVGERFDEEQKATQEVEDFRNDLYNDKKQKNDEGEKTVLDELIAEEKIDVNKKEETLPEIEELNTNLEKFKKDNEPLVVDFEDEKEELPPKKDRLAGYSDYHLDEEEIEELEELNYLDRNTDNANIDSLIREVSPNNKVLKRNNDVDKFVDEKMVPHEVVEKRVAEQNAKQLAPQEEYYDDYDDYDDYEEHEERGIKYTEKLYTNDVSEYFDNGEGRKLGEYKIVDHGYRPVSKEKIENNQRILDEIFAKYSNSGVSTPRKSVTSTMMETNTITPKTRNVGKFKPSPVYSSIYGSGPRKTPTGTIEGASTPPVPAEEKKLGISQVGLSINNEEPKKEEISSQKDTSASKKVEESTSIYKEIAAQEETVWNIGSSKRVPKTKTKKTTKKK